MWGGGVGEWGGGGGRRGRLTVHAEDEEEAQGACEEGVGDRREMRRAVEGREGAEEESGDDAGEEGLPGDRAAAEGEDEGVPGAGVESYTGGVGEGLGGIGAGTGWAAEERCRAGGVEGATGGERAAEEGIAGGDGDGAEGDESWRAHCRLRRCRGREMNLKLVWVLKL